MGLTVHVFVTAGTNWMTFYQTPTTLRHEHNMLFFVIRQIYDITWCNLTKVNKPRLALSTSVAGISA